jgi:hypothetical protein
MDLAGSRFPVGPWCQSDKCRDAELVWCHTTRDRILVQAQPDPKGNIQLRDTGGPDPLALVLTNTLVATKQPGTLHLPHFAVCPDAARYRRRK